MSWSSIVSSEDVVAIHAILVPTLNGDGEILIVGGDNHSYAGNNPGSPHDYLHSRRYNCRTGMMITGNVPTPDFDLFCCGQAFLGDGRPLLAGGTAEFPPDAPSPHHEHQHFDGHRHAALYHYYEHAMHQVADMNPEPGFTTGGGRWYPTLCTLGNGDVYIFQGHPLGSDGRHGNNTPERYRLLSGDWVLLPEIGDVGSDPILYSRLFVLNDGKVFASSLVNGLGQNIRINAFDGTVEEVCGLPEGDYLGFGRSAVMLMLSNADSYANKILLCGSATSQRINLSDASPAWSTVNRDGSAAGTQRVNCSATLLPTGQVILSGGTSDNDGNNAVANPELYNPATNEWQTLNDPAAVKRNYHSSALLMPDGNIWTGGGNAPTQPYGSGPGVEQEQIEVYAPPYPGGPRPTINACPGSTTYGSTIDVVVNDGSIITKVVLMRCGSFTHSFNNDQRGIVLEFTHDGNTLHTAIPTNSNVVIPGPYMLFTIDNAGRPCQYARFIRIGFQSVEIITDRSTFSKLEVDAQLPGTAVFQNAFYVVFDGFLPSELSGFTVPPNITFTAETGGAPIAQMGKVHVNTLYENNALPPDVPQKVTFVFNVTFTGDDAFGFAELSKNVRITATLLDRKAEATVNLIKAPNPYMVDGPTSWLSVDVAVFTMRQDGPTFATIPQEGSGTDFITNLVHRFNDRTIYPGDDLHPFNDLAAMQSSMQLEWLETLDSHRVFNYAVAKVRYKAPVPAVPPPTANDAVGVKVFFRMFNTAGTAMQYNPGTTYKVGGTGDDRIAVMGKEGGLISSIPFFASPRVNYETALMASQPDPLNRQTLPAGGNVEKVVYFGCWLDFNQPLQKIPTAEDATHGTSFVHLQAQIHGVHQCLVAEVFFDDDPTPGGATPGSSDNLSQRNLVLAHSDNPGNASTHTVQHTFEISPSQFHVPGAGIAAVPSVSVKNNTAPDFILIHWNNLPADSKITVYMPDVNVDDLFALEAFTRVSPTGMTREDEHTFSFVHSGISYFPVPGGLSKNIPALLTIELPDNVVKGQLFHVLVQQARMYGTTRRIIGSFQFDIPVSTAAQLLPREMRNLSILKYVRQSMAVSDPWRLIFNRYILELSNKVNGLGGDASQVPAATDDRWMGNGKTDSPELKELNRLIQLCCRKNSVLIVVVILLLLVLILVLIFRLK